MGQQVGVVGSIATSLCPASLVHFQALVFHVLPMSMGAFRQILWFPLTYQKHASRWIRWIINKCMKCLLISTCTLALVLLLALTERCHRKFCSGERWILQAPWSLNDARGHLGLCSSLPPC